MPQRRPTVRAALLAASDPLMNTSTRTIVFAQDEGPVCQFVWSKIAKFWHSQPDTSPTALKAGMRVQVNLHNPLFGPDYVTKIVLLQPRSD